jgi:hypothetical protein
MTHARGLIADGYALFGSHGFNGFLSGRMGEIAIVSANHSLVSQLESFFQESIVRSVRHPGT